MIFHILGRGVTLSCRGGFNYTNFRGILYEYSDGKFPTPVAAKLKYLYVFRGDDLFE